MTGMYFRKWDPSGREARAVILLIHGAMEHSGRYAEFAEWLNQRQVAVCSGDLPGHGQSPGKQGHIHIFDEYTDAIGEFFHRTRRMVPDAPLFLLGHSMGGLAVIRFLQKQLEPLPIRGVILCSPCLGLQLDLPLWKEKAAVLLNRCLPGLRMKNEIRPEWVTRSPENIASYAADPFVCRKASVRWYHELHTAMDLAMRQAIKIDLPLLTLQAGADRLVKPESSRKFVELVHSRDKQFLLFDNWYHELLQEPEREQIFEKIWSWCEARL